MGQQAEKRVRRRFEAEEKVEVLRRHLVKGEKISDLCEEMGTQPSQVYRWQKDLFENGSSAFRQNGKRENLRVRTLEKEVEALKGKLARKDEVIGEIMADHVRLKKSLGEA